MAERVWRFEWDTQLGPRPWGCVCCNGSQEEAEWLRPGTPRSYDARLFGELVGFSCRECRRLRKSAPVDLLTRTAEGYIYYARRWCEGVRLDFDVEVRRVVRGVVRGKYVSFPSCRLVEAYYGLLERAL
jgi:hypothetical protein